MNHNINADRLKTELVNYFDNLSPQDFSKFYSIKCLKSTSCLRKLDSLINMDNKYVLSKNAHLEIYSRIFFDAFMRENKFEYQYIDGTKIYTSIGQLNYFKWLFQSSIL